MISILLTLLKIIGIVLLSLLGLLLVLLLIVLFVPVRYRIKGYYKEEFVCHLKATWLLHLVSLTLDFDKEVLTSFRIFGMDISSFINKAKNRTTSSPKTKAKPVTQQTKAETEAESQKEIKTDAPEENHNESHSLKHSSEPVTQEEDTADSSAHSGGKTTIRDRILSADGFRSIRTRSSGLVVWTEMLMGERRIRIIFSKSSSVMLVMVT